MKHILAFSSLLVAVHGTADHRFYTYPVGYVPSADTGDYSLFNASTLIPEVTKDDVLESHQFSKNFRGFVFDEHGNVTKILAKVALGATFTNDWGSLVPAATPETYFVEQIPVENDNRVFVFKFFDFVEHPDATPEDYKCLIGTDKAECKDIPRCMGYIEGECLVSSASRGEKLIAAPGKVFHEKKKVHDSIKGIVDNAVLFWSLYGTAVGVMFAFPSVLNKLTKRNEKSDARVRDIFQLQRVNGGHL